ncbi:MAG: hypothetical protein ABJB17_04815 [Burkholderiales bacterium]
MQAAPFDNAVAIFTARETPEVLRATMTAASAAAAQASASAPDRRSMIDVLVNGNIGLAEAAAQHARTLIANVASAPRLRVWHLALADKAHAWNQYIDAIWPTAELAFFVDGYVRLWPNTLERLSARVHASADAMGGSGVPTVGRSAAAATRAMLADGGIHGNCFCLKRATLLQLNDIGFRLPLGLYRGDSLIGAALAYRLNPAKYRWDLKRAVVVEPTATWDMQDAHFWRLSDWRARWRRLDRQAQGQLENLAVREHLTLRRQPPQTLPRTAAELVVGWAERCPDAASHLIRSSSRVARAFEAFREPRDWRAAEVPPELVGDTASDI